MLKSSTHIASHKPSGPRLCGLHSASISHLFLVLNQFCSPKVDIFALYNSPTLHFYENTDKFLPQTARSLV